MKKPKSKKQANKKISAISNTWQYIVITSYVKLRWGAIYLDLWWPWSGPPHLHEWWSTAEAPTLCPWWQSKRHKQSCQNRFHSSSAHNIEALCAHVYLAGALELLLVKIKVSTQSPHSKQWAQESRFVSHQSGAVGVLLVLGLEFCQSSYKITHKGSKS